ncbi:predicted protein [Nematostella vectensis]|uniref:Uncharacterized protein n=1 Tax=Nematostella vectensis TaxID=45351 RepID=A7RIU6_NEMVE|nr:predicted protein [Nematostella vectensis]|eukprot:XP_001640634.1 predicted protein [Nematostella vectensis]
MEASVESLNEDLETEIHNAKSYLLKTSASSNINVYDHLASVLTQLLTDRPEASTEILDELVRDKKRAVFKPNFDTIQDQQDDSTEVLLARTQQTLFERRPEKSFIEPEPEPDPELDEDLLESPLPDIMELANYFEQAGVGLNREETFRIFLALKQLVDSHPIRSCRLWGKILGLQGNYIIAEVEFHEGEDPLDMEEPQEHEHILTPDYRKSKHHLKDFDVEDDDIPKADYKPPSFVPKEENRTGCNKKTYFVCTEAGKPWVRLPSVTPAQIRVARQIKKFFTGNLDAPVVSYPPFPGNEANFLRAQIARISATTHISPLGYYMFEEEEEEEDEAAARDTFVVNQEFEGLTVGDMTDPSCANWVHHVQYILPQGRCSWFNPSQKKDEEEMEEEDEEEEREEPDEPEPETGPPLLTPLSEDGEVDGMPPWATHKSSTLVPQYSISVMHSNLWPGAHAFALERKFENIYVGWGQKYAADNYSPPPPPVPQEEYPSGPDITEAEDPSVEEEKALKAAQQEALDAQDMEEEEEDEDEDD